MLFDRDYTKLTDELRRRSLQRSGILVMHYDNLIDQYSLFNVSSMKIIKRESADYHTRVLSLSSVSLETGNKPLSHQ